MKKEEIKIGGEYKAKVNGKATRVRITSESIYGGWDGVNMLTNRPILIKTAHRLKRELTPNAFRPYPFN